MPNTPSVSIGQAAANALAAWLQTALSPDVTVFSRWPEASVSLPPKAVSVIKIGRRERLDVVTGTPIASRVNATSSLAQIEVQLGSFVQPIQLDVWTTNDIDRDDLINQLDDALTTGMLQTLNVNDDPVRDGVLVPLLASDGFSGTVDCWLDEPDIPDTPDRMQQTEYRVTYLGEARGSFNRIRQVPRLVTPKLQATYSDGTGIQTTITTSGITGRSQ